MKPYRLNYCVSSPTYAQLYTTEEFYTFKEAKERQNEICEDPYHKRSWILTPPKGEGWILVDMEKNKFYRALDNDTFEFREDWKLATGRIEFKQHVIELNLSEFTWLRVLAIYGFNSIDHLCLTYPEYWKYVLANMIFDLLPKYD